MKDYHNLNPKSDVLLSVDAFEDFRNNSLKNNGLCLIPDPDTHTHIYICIYMYIYIYIYIYIFFEKGTRGGISYISNTYSKANNKYLKSYDPKQESKHKI